MHHIFGQEWAIVVSQIESKCAALVHWAVLVSEIEVTWLILFVLAYGSCHHNLLLFNGTLNRKFNVMQCNFVWRWIQIRSYYILEMVWQSIDEYNNHFNQKSQEIKAGPVESRSCTEWGCLIAFVIIFLATFGGGGYLIYAGKDQIIPMVTQTSSDPSLTGFGYVMAKLAGPVVGMMGLSSALSVLMVVLAKAFPRPVMYFLIAFTFLVYAAFIILGFVINSLGLAISFIIVALFTACMLYCFWSYITIGLRLLECAARFITEKPAVYFISLMCLFLNVAFTVFWVFSWLSIYSKSKVADTENTKNIFNIIGIVWYALGVFWGFYLYYCMVFLIASACAYWYYQSENNSVLRGINNIKYHLGSICFGAIVVTIITMLRILATARRSEGSLRILAAIAECLLRCVEDYIKILNNNAIIVMAVTGEGYIDSAKSTISLIFDNLSLFIILDYFTTFYNVFSVVFIGLLPAGIGGAIIYQIESTAGNSQASSYAVWGGVIIFLLSLIISSVIIGMLNQALSCIYIFYCFDRKFATMGIKVNNIPPEIKAIFQEGSTNQDAHQASLQYLNNYQAN